MLSFKPIDADKCQQITKDISLLVDLIDLEVLDNLNRGIVKAELSNYQDEHIKSKHMIDAFCNATNAKIKYGFLFSHYCEEYDDIGIRDKKTYLDRAFSDATENFYTDIFHELIHWTGVKHRLNREPLEGLIYSEEVAYEELIAELGSSYLGVQFNISKTPLLASTSYIKRKLEDLDNDKDYINKASKEAFKAVEYLNNLVLNKT